MSIITAIRNALSLLIRGALLQEVEEPSQPPHLRLVVSNDDIVVVGRHASFYLHGAESASPKGDHSHPHSQGGGQC